MVRALQCHAHAPRLRFLPGAREVGTEPKDMNMRKLKNAVVSAIVVLAAAGATTGNAALDYRYYGDILGAFPDQAIDGGAVSALFTAGVYPDGAVLTEYYSADPGLFTAEGFETTGYVEWPQNGLRDEAFDGGPSGDSGSNDYGAAFSGILYPPATGTYTFHVRSDDGSELFLNTDGFAAGEAPVYLDPASDAALISRDGCCAEFATDVSEPILLEVGKGYPMEFIWKEGGGGDYMQIAWSFEGDEMQLLDAYYVQRDVRYGDASLDGIDAIQGFLLDTLEGREFPGVGIEFDKATVATVEWEIDRGSGFEKIGPDDGFIGYDSPLLTSENALLEWDGLEVRAIVDGETSDAVELEIDEDDDAPDVISADGFGTPEGGGIRVVFDEPVEETSATNPANYSITGQTVGGVRLLNPTTVLLDIGVFQAVEMELTVNGVTDKAVARNAVESEEVPIRFGAEEFQVLIFEDMLPRIGGSSLANLIANIERLRADSRFPGEPSQVGTLVNDNFDVVQSDALLGGPNLSDFGGFTFGRVVIEEAGDYQFAIRSDDPGAFYLSSDASTLNLPPVDQPTIYEEGCCDALGAGAPEQTATLSLDAGEYAFEAYYFEFGGGDYLEIGWRRSDADAWEHIPANNLVQVLQTGELSFVQQPTATTAEELRPYSFEVVVTGSDRLGIGYQWFKNDAAIPGATGPRYDVAVADLADDGAVFNVVAFNQNGTATPITSAPVALTVNADVTAPTITSALGTTGADFNRITLTWSEPLDATTARNTDLYTVTGPDGEIPVDLASLSMGDTVVTLETANFDSGDALTVNAVGVEDPSEAGNPSNETVSFTASGTSIFQRGLNDYDGVSDTQIRGATPERNDGDVAALNPDGSDGGRPVEILIKFEDVFGDGPGQIPSENVKIESATLILDNFGPGSNQELYPMLQDWEESEVIWNDYPGDDGVPKDDVFARSTPDVTFATPVAILEIPIPVTTIDGWRRDPSSNFGWVTEPLGSNGVDFHSSEATDPTQRPILEVVWTPIGDVEPVFLSEAADVSVAEAQPYEFAIELIDQSDIIGAVEIQWFKDGAPIDGAILPTLRFNNANVADSGSEFSVEVTGGGVTITSSATLNVIPDETAPSVVGVSATTGATSEVELTFDEVVDVASASNPANYSIAGAEVVSADVSEDGRVVTLTVSELAPSQNINVVVDGVTDTAAAMNATSASASAIVRGLAVFQEGLNGYEGAADTQVRGASPTRNDGELVSLNPDGSDGGFPVQVLLRWDNMFGDEPGQIPAGASIRSVNLFLDTFDPGSDQQLHQLLDTWDENEVVWNDFDSANGVLVDGTHAKAIPDTTFAAPAELLNIPLPPTTIQNWLDGKEENNGWVTFPTGGGGVDFHSSEAAEVSQRPRLEVQWDLEPLFVSTFQDGVNGYEGTQDTQIRGATPDRNDGAFTELNPDGDDGGAPVHILIRFDDLFGGGFGQIPEGAIVQSAKLFLDTTNPGSDQDLHQMLTPWEQNVVVWNDFEGGNGVVPNGTIAREEADVRFAAPAELLEIDIPASTIQGWLDGDTPNYGWATQPTGGNGQDFFASEYEEVSRRPKLEVVWSLTEVEPPPTVEISAVSIDDAGALVIEYTGTLQTSPNVVGPYADVDGASSPYTVAPDATVFFRVVQ